MRWLIIPILLVAGLAAAQDGGYMDPTLTECWRCHAPSRDPTPMTPAFAVDPGLTVFDGDTTLRPSIVNTWLAEVSQTSLEVDISAAPSLAFTGGAPPTQNVTAGTIIIDTQPTSLTGPHATALEIEVPPGASALRIRLAPTETGPTGPDLAMAVTDAVSDRPFARADDAGAGQPEELRLDDPASIAEHGSGAWSVEASIRPVGTDGHVDPRVGRVDVRVTVEAWFNTSLERVMVLDGAATLYPGGAEPFTIPVTATGVQAGEAITFTSRARVFYEHGNSYPDEAWLVYSETFVIGADGGTPTLGTHAAVARVPTASSALAGISEAIGYGAAFLMLASVLSGGILGKGSRRAMNRMFLTARRRVAFHNFLSYGILMAAFAHLVLFLIEIKWHWAWGLLWGGLGILSLFALGFTGALQVPIIRRWGFPAWRWMHFGMAIAAILFTVVHILLDGSHFAVRDAIGWTDPLVPDSRQ